MSENEKKYPVGDKVELSVELGERALGPLMAVSRLVRLSVKDYVAGLVLSAAACDAEFLERVAQAYGSGEEKRRIGSARHLLEAELEEWNAAHDPRDGALYAGRRWRLDPKYVAETPAALRKKYFERAEVDAALRRASEKGGKE